MNKITRRDFLKGSAATMAVSLFAGLGVSAEEATATEGGSVTICYPGQEAVTCFLPFSTSTGDRFAVAPAMESLGRQDADGNTYGWLAESITADYDTLTATIVLNQGIQFSDGTDFNAEAVIWNFDKMIEGGKASELGTPDSYEATDDYTIVLTYSEWANNIETVLGEVFIYCPSAFDENGEDWAAINPVGTGPFILQEYVQGDHMTYTKNENYWRDGEPYLDEITINWLSDTTAQVSAFVNSEINLLVSSDATVRDQISAYGEDTAQKSADLANIKYVMFCSGQEESPFYDLRVRQAVMHAIDWEGFAYSLVGNYGEAITQFGVPGAWSYDEDVKFYEYDLELAKELLTEAGYPDGFDTTISTIESNNNIAVLMQAACAEIGINVEINVMTDADFNAEKAEGVYDYGMITGQGASKLDFTNNYIRLYSSQGVNYLNMMAHPEDYEEALFGARSAVTLDEKKELLKTASRLMCSDYALIIPVAAMYAGCYTHGEVIDSGLAQTVGVQWSPEIMYLSE
ncbi:MAG: ABC transporter substrate-binding protein [Clostridiales bacterium]|nr:ABC transporter substrate-binding protein [Clostridiales bacterium]